jgi:hypothetical protein
LNESDSEAASPVIEDKEDLFFATEIETHYVPIEAPTSALENVQLREDHSRLTQANN